MASKLINKYSKEERFKNVEVKDGFFAEEIISLKYMIKSLDGVGVHDSNIHIRKESETNRIHFRIFCKYTEPMSSYEIERMDNILTGTGNKLYYATARECIEYVFNEAIPNLRYCKIKDKITLKIKDNQEAIDQVKYIEEVNDHVNPRLKECCVCHDYCSTKTECNHSICRACNERLIQKKCPYCRKGLPGYESDSESD